MKKMLLNQHSRIIGVFPSLQEAGEVLKHLVLSGFPLSKISLIGGVEAPISHSTDVLVMRELVNQARAGALTGTATGLTTGMMVGNICGCVAGLLLAFGMLVTPGVGQVMLATGTATAFTLCSGGIGAVSGGLIGALIGLAMTEEQAKVYSDQVSLGNYLVIMSGSLDEIQRAELIVSCR